jgi:hypothetical protein
LFTQRQHTTVVCGGGGLHKYQSVAADALQRSLVPRFRFRARLSAGVAAMTSDIKGGELLFLGLHNVFAHRASEEAEPVRHDG